MLQLLNPAEGYPFLEHTAFSQPMSHKRRAFALQEQDEQHPAKRAALCNQTQDCTALMLLDSDCSASPADGQQQAVCQPTLDLDQQHGQQQQQQQQQQEQQEQEYFSQQHRQQAGMALQVTTQSPLSVLRTAFVGQQCRVIWLIGRWTKGTSS
jgi:hypothetical protein